MSSGFLTSDVFLLSPNASASVKIPTLPVYINSIRIIFDAADSTGVRDMLNPTVPIADTVSKSTSLKGATVSGSTAQMNKVAVMTTMRQETKIARA